MTQTAHPIRTEDVYPLSAFQQKTDEHIARLQLSKRPEALTANGKAVLVVQDADAYHRLLALADRMETLLAVKEGVASARRGGGVLLEDFDREMRSKHGMPTPGRPAEQGDR